MIVFYLHIVVNNYLIESVVELCGHLGESLCPGV